MVLICVMSVKKFSLIELLLVIAVIAILISILMPSLVSARELAIGKVCMNNQRNIGVFTQLFMSDKNGMTPRHNTGGAVWPGRWYSQLQPYSEAEDVYKHSTYRCPSKDNIEHKWYDAMYGIAKAISCQDNSGNPNKVFKKSWAWYRPDFATSTSENVIFAESEGAGFSWRTYNGLGHLGPGHSFTQYGYAGYTRDNGIDAQHGGVVNQLFADGHVLSLKAKSIKNVTAFREYAEKYFYPPQDYTVIPPSAPPGMFW